MEIPWDQSIYIYLDIYIQHISRWFTIWRWSPSYVTEEPWSCFWKTLASLHLPSLPHHILNLCWSSKWVHPVGTREPFHYPTLCNRDSHWKLSFQSTHMCGNQPCSILTLTEKWSLCWLEIHLFTCGHETEQDPVGLLDTKDFLCRFPVSRK